MTFQIPGALRQFAGGRSQVNIEQPGTSVNSALLALWALCPGMRDRVLTEQGELRQHINIFVGDENIRYTGGLATRVSSESVISIVPAISGRIGLEFFEAADCDRRLEGPDRKTN